MPIEEKYQLPLFVDSSRLPTNKNHVSYSEVSDWMDCSFKHKLKHIDKIALDNPSINTAVGQIIHGAMETYLKTRILPSPVEILETFEKDINDLYSQLSTAPHLQKKLLDQKQEFKDNIVDMIYQVPAWLDITFPGWVLVSAEHDLFEPIESQTNLRFKGFIDAVIKTPKKQKKTKKFEEQKSEWNFWVIDFKTCSWGWQISQKRDFQKQLQLILYKYFLSKLMYLDTKDVKCAFVLIKRLPKKLRSPGDRLELVPVSVGPKSYEKATKQLQTMLNQVKKKIFIKNRASCEKFCPYLHTKWCP
jgi:hypothetical protein